MLISYLDSETFEMMKRQEFRFLWTSLAMVIKLKEGYARIPCSQALIHCGADASNSCSHRGGVRGLTFVLCSIADGQKSRKNGAEWLTPFIMNIDYCMSGRAPSSPSIVLGGATKFEHWLKMGKQRAKSLQFPYDLIMPRSTRISCV